jgi:gamma-glutamyltranspeptidase/glutathione hydrolase
MAGVVPGLFGGWIAALERFGTMSLAEVVQPAIDYAENGHPIEKSVVDSIESQKTLFESFPSSARMFLPSGQVPSPGQMFTMPDLARTLRKVVEAEKAALGEGRSRKEALAAAHDRFYKGDIAEEMARFYRENGGFFTKEDFAAYKARWTDPIHTTYRGYDIYTSPSHLPGGETIGQTQFQALLNILDYGMSIQEAIEAPRISVFADPNFYKPGVKMTIRAEGRISAETIGGLKGMGHHVEVIGDYALGSVQGILRNPATGTMAAGADPRRVAYAIGW